MLQNSVLNRFHRCSKLIAQFLKNSGGSKIKELKINEDIDANEVMLIDENGSSRGIVSIDQALYLAYEAGLDLVQVNSPTDGRPVTKIMDYGKYRYAQEKLASKQKVKSKGPETKEIRLSLKINSHDLNFKANQAQKFLQNNDKVKISVKLMGREMMFPGRVKELLEKFKNNAQGEFEGPIERLGNRFSVVLRGKPNETKNS